MLMGIREQRVHILAGALLITYHSCQPCSHLKWALPQEEKTESQKQAMG